MGGTDKTPDGFKTQYKDAGGGHHAGEVKTAFATQENIDSMKAMLADAKPELVTDVADAWKHIHDHLVNGGGSVKSDFDKAVEHVLQHWEGEAAEEFAKKAKKISKQISDCATYAGHTSVAMRNAGEKLHDIKPKVDAIEKPSDWDSAMNSLGDGFSRDDHKWRTEIHGNRGAQQALDKHDDDLSAGKEEQLRTAALMEDLAMSYSSQTKTMGSWHKRKPPTVGDKDDYPGDPGGVAPVPFPVGPDTTGPGQGTPGMGRSGGTVGGSTTPKTNSPGIIKGDPSAGTKIDGIKGGTAHKTVPGGGSTGPVSGGGPGAGSTTGTGPGGGPAGGPGLVGRASGNRGIAGARKGFGGRMPGGLGSGAGAGAGGKGVAAGGRGPLARQKGGTLDTPEEGKASTRQGGQGLHSSRGGSQAGQRGRNSGMVRGGVAGNNAKGKDGKKREGERPDYLVEDEETWMPHRRDVTPPTID